MMKQSLTLAEMLAAIRPLFERAKFTDNSAVDEQRAIAFQDAWAALVHATEAKYRSGPRPLGVLKTDLAQRYDDIDQLASTSDTGTTTVASSATAPLEAAIDGISREFGDAVRKLRRTGADQVQDAYISGLQRALQIIDSTSNPL